MRSIEWRHFHCPLSGRGLGHMTHSRISHSMKYLWNGVKFCMLTGYIKC